MIPWSNFFNIYTEPLDFFQIIPDSSIENSRKLETIVNSFHATKKSFLDRINMDNHKIAYHKKNYISYSILFTLNKISFNIGIPTLYSSFIAQRYNTVFPDTTLLPANDPLLNFSVNDCLQFNIIQEGEYFKSLHTDFRSSAPLPSLFSVSKDLQNDDKILFEVLIDPVDDYWKITAEDTIKKYRKGFNQDKPKNLLEYIIFTFIKIIESIFSIFDNLMEVKTSEEIRNIQKINFSSHTNQKISYDGFNCLIRILSSSDNLPRQEQFGKNILTALRDISDDQELILQKKFHPKDLTRKIPILSKNIFSTKELAILIQLPEDFLQREYDIIESIQIRETKLPEQLFNNGIILGEVKYKGKLQNVTWNTIDYDVATLPVAIFGFQGSGKTEYEINYAISAIEHDQSLFVLDGIKNCELSEKILDYLPPNFPEDKIVILDFSNLDYVIPLNWNEVKIQNLKSQSDKFLVSNHLIQKLILFLDSLVDDSAQRLTPRMRRYLNAAGLLVFSLPDTTMMDVLDCLVDYDIRMKFIEQSNLPPDNKIIRELITLNKGKDTNYNDIKGIVDRLDLLLGDYILNTIFSIKNITNNINFKYFADNGYAVFCKMPQNKLSDGTIDSLMTYLISKIWLAHLMRGEDKNIYKITNVIIDEIHKYPTARKTLDNIREMRKYGLKYVISAHKPSDFKDLLLTLKSAGANYMLFNTNKENLQLFEEELLPYTIKECMETKKYHSKCIINFNKEYCTFDAKIVPPIDETKQKTDRNNLILQSQIKYGVKN
jgi:hypothetical protein